MDLQQFRQSLEDNEPPGELDQTLHALWHDGRSNWARAHEIVQSQKGAQAAWVHAYLHRKEGDLANADYWYQRAGRQRPETALESEWEAIVTALLR